MSNDFYTLRILPYSGIIIKICRAYTNRPEDFEDYYQEVCLQIWKSRKNYKEKAEWSTWVYRITLNICLTLTKKRDSNKNFLQNHRSVSTESNHWDAENDKVNFLYNAIKKLSEIDRAIILLYLEEKSYKEIAEILGTSSTNIGVKINRIKKRLKKLLNGKIN